MSAEACRNCRFWKLDESTHGLSHPIGEGDIAFGWCRRNAPTVKGELAALGVPRPTWGRDLDRDEEIASTLIYRASVQPVSESDEWCGEYQLRRGA
jgi:hypothetical protein